MSFVFAACAGRQPPPPEEPEVLDEEEQIDEEIEEGPGAPPLEPGAVDGGEVPTEEEPATAPGEGEPPAEGADLVSQLEGDYRYASGRGSVDRSIERVVSQMNLVTRGIARRRLAQNNKVPSKVSIERDGEEIVVTLDSRAYRAPLGDSKRVRDTDGGTSRMRYRVVGKKLRQTFSASEGTRTNVFTPRKDGGIDMTVTIASPRLPESVHYRISFSPA